MGMEMEGDGLFYYRHREQDELYDHYFPNKQRLRQQPIPPSSASNSDDDDDDNDYYYDDDGAMSCQGSVCSRFSTTRGEGKSSFTQCVFNLSNKLMGVGLLGLPYALKLAGWYGGTAAFLSLSLITWRTSIFIGRELRGSPRPASTTTTTTTTTTAAAAAVPLRTFPDIASHAFGDTGYWVLSLIFYFELFSTICILFVTIGDHLNPLFPGVHSDGLTALAGVLSLLPTLILTNPARMSYLSAVGTCCTMLIVSTIVISAIGRGDVSQQMAATYVAADSTNSNNHYGDDDRYDDGDRSDDVYYYDNTNDQTDDGATTTTTTTMMMTDYHPYHQAFDVSGLLFSLGLVSYCFSGHAIVPSIYTSMKYPQQFESMVTVTYGIVTATCMAVAVSGYYMFGSTVLDQITLSLEESAQDGGHGWLMSGLTVLLVITSFSKITLTIFPVATGMEDLIEPFLPTAATRTDYGTKYRWLCGKRNNLEEIVAALIKFILTVLALLVSVFVPSFSYLVALVGMICTMTVSVIFPSAAYLKMFGPALGVGEKCASVVFILVGFFIAIVGTLDRTTGFFHDEE